MRFTSSRTIAAAVLLAALCVTMLILSGCLPKLTPEPVWEKDARALLDQADTQYALRQYEPAVKIVNNFLYQYPNSRSRDRALFLMGDIRLTQRDYARALTYYKQIIQEFPASSFIIDSRYKLGICYFELKDFDLAVPNLEDRSRIVDPAKLKRIADMLSTAYVAQKKYLPAVNEFLYLADTAQTEQQKSGYRERIRELIEKNMAEQDLSALSNGSKYPADVAQLRLAGLMLEQRKFRDAISASKVFLDRFPSHPEKTRAEMVLNEASARLAGPRYAIGALLPQSGHLSFFGDRVLKGIQLALYTYNLKYPDSRVELLVKDTEGSPEKAVSGLNELASKRVIATIGPLLTKEAEAIAPLLDKVKIPVITPAASGEDIGKLSPWMFRNALTNSSQAAAAAHYVTDQRLRKVVVLYPDDAYGKDLARHFTKNLERKAEILASVAYPSDVKDFGPYIRKVIEIDLRSQRIHIPEDEAEHKKLLLNATPHFDAVYLPGSAEKVGLLIPQLAFYNIKGVAIIGSNNWHTPDLIERADRHADGAIFTDGFFPESTDPAVKAVIDAYRSAYQETPDILSAQAYDATMMVLSLLKGYNDTPQTIKDGLLTLKDYPGISGATTFSGNGEAQKKVFLIKVQDGKFVLGAER